MTKLVVPDSGRYATAVHKLNQYPELVKDYYKTHSVQETGLHFHVANGAVSAFLHLHRVNIRNKYPYAKSDADIWYYYSHHPNDTEKQVASALGLSGVYKVNRVIRKHAHGHSVMGIYSKINRYYKSNGGSIKQVAKHFNIDPLFVHLALHRLYPLQNVQYYADKSSNADTSFISCLKSFSQRCYKLAKENIRLKREVKKYHKLASLIKSMK